MPAPAQWMHQVTLSPVFILLLEENSFRDRVTSLERGAGQSCEWGGDPPSGVGGSAKPVSHPGSKPAPGHSLGHLGDVLVAQGDPQVIILIQENLLDPGLTNATGLVPGMTGGVSGWHRGDGAEGTHRPRTAGFREVGGHQGSSWLCKVISPGIDLCPSCTLQLLNVGKGLRAEGWTSPFVPVQHCCLPREDL